MRRGEISLNVVGTVGALSGEAEETTESVTLLGGMIMADMKDRIKGGIDETADRAKNATDRGFDAAGTAKQEGQNIVDRVKDGAHTLADRAGEYTGQAKQKVKEWAGDANDAAKVAGQKVEQWADDAYEVAADKVSDFGKEVTTLIRNHPIPAVLIGLGIGVLLGRTARVI